MLFRAIHGKVFEQWKKASDLNVDWGNLVKLDVKDIIFKIGLFPGEFTVHRQDLVEIKEFEKLG